MAELIPFSYSHGSSTCYSNRLHDFSVTNPRCYIICQQFLFSHRYSLSGESIPSVYDLSDFKFRVKLVFLYAFHIFFFVFFFFSSFFSLSFLLGVNSLKILYCILCNVSNIVGTPHPITSPPFIKGF